MQIAATTKIPATALIVLSIAPRGETAIAKVDAAAAAMMQSTHARSSFIYYSPVFIKAIIPADIMKTTIHKSNRVFIIENTNAVFFSISEH